MEIHEFEPAMLGEWDAFVAAHPLAGYGHLSANFSLAAATPGVRNVSLVVREGRTLIGVLPLFEQNGRALRAVALRTWTSGAFFPAGPLIAPGGKVEASALAQVLDAVRERARARGTDQVIVGHPAVTGGAPTSGRMAYSPLLHHGFHPRPGVGLGLDLTQTADRLAAGRKSGCRQTINKAVASGAVVTTIGSREEWMACHPLNVQTLGPLALSEAEVAAIWDAFIAPGHAVAHGVHADGKLCAAVVTIRANGTAYYWHGWRAAAPVQGASHLGLWSAILACQDAGVRFFELGSLEFGDPKNVGISQFKQSFGGVPFPTLSAQLDMRPVKSAALSLAAALIARARRRRPAQKASAAAPAPASLAPVVHT